MHPKGTHPIHFFLSASNGFGDLLSTVIDLQLFINVLFVKKSLLTGQSLEQMMQFTPVTSSSRQFGLGIFKDFLGYGPDGYAYGHTGGDLGYTSALYWLPEKRASFAQLINYGNNVNSNLRPVLWEFRYKLTDRIIE